MSRVLVSEFRQESNSFNPVTSPLNFWRQNGLLEGRSVPESFRGTETVLGGFIDTLEREELTVETVYAMAMSCQSGGPAEQDVMETYLESLLETVRQHLPLDAVLLSCHGALQTTRCDDPEAEIARLVRELVGDRCVISVALDLHAYVSEHLIMAANYVCGYQTYPHTDYASTGGRAARLALDAASRGTERAPVMAWAPVDMVVSAAGYSTRDGPFRDVIDHGASLVAAGTVRDFSVFQMQPWLDVPAGHSAVVVVADSEEAAREHAVEVASLLFAARHEFDVELISLNEALDTAERPDSRRPVVIVDAADSCNAGAPGDSMAVVALLLERGTDLRCAAVVNDAVAVERAFEVGVGATGRFSVGGSKDPDAISVDNEWYVRSLHDGVFVQEGPAGRGTVQRIGRSAVVRSGSCDVVVCGWMAGNGDPQLFRAFGIEPTLYDLLVVKANTSFREAYEPLAGLIIYADTPGAAATTLSRLPYRRLPRTLHPWAETPTPPGRVELGAPSLPIDTEQDKDRP